MDPVLKEFCEEANLYKKMGLDLGTIRRALSERGLNHNKIELILQNIYSIDCETEKISDADKKQSKMRGVTQIILGCILVVLSIFLRIANMYSGGMIATIIVFIMLLVGLGLLLIGLVRVFQFFIRSKNI